ncbi:Uncharacterised protein [Amycolatopsis camponoti]|uniref:Uncharacterized protein n=1 Tax=Amycolatopsis camponoti TaxID=2606593 RepID=A0A6I8M2T8_9PSEU|nr:hypothetical protein [Amycolatopsis camponoti]VVJ24896.1 Uncharacterised protein [Amycolatopsis camponoti]
MSFWPVGAAASFTFAGTAVVVAPVSAWAFKKVGLPQWPQSTALDHVVWERDRVLALAKGTATSALGFLSAVIVALLKHEINDRVPGLAVLCCLLGAVGLLVFAARMSVSVRLTAATETDPR